MTDQELKDLVAGLAVETKEIKSLFKETERIMKERSQETEARFRETERIMNERSKEIKQISQDIGGISHSNALVAEEYFFRILEKKLEFGGMHFDFAEFGRNRSCKLPDGSLIEGQYDIMLANGEAIAIIEVKYKARTKDVDKIIKTDSAKFKLLFPEYKDYKLYFGIAGLNLNKHVEKKALENGVAVLRQKGDVAEIFDKNLRAFY